MRKSLARRTGSLVGGLAFTLLPGVLVYAQQGPQSGTMSDAQVEANVLKALAAAPDLSAQNIQSSTVYGTVTLTGSVQDEAKRTQAENLAARAPGVQKVVDELTIGNTASSPGANGGGAPPSQENGQQPVLQSDGSYAPPAPAQPASPYDGSGVSGANPAPPGYVNGQEAYGQQGAQQQEPGQPAYGGSGGVQGAPNYPSQQAGGYAPQPGYPTQPAYPQQQPGYPQQQGYPQQPQGYAQQPGYPPQAVPEPQGGQRAGLEVQVPSGALLRIRINRGLDSKHIAAGTPFDGTVLSDVAAGGAIAIPRGATVQGVVVDAKKAGALKGEGELSLQLNNVTLGGVTYPITSDIWAQEGRDKSVRTVNSALGLGVLGALVGGIAGGGAGAAVGAGVGAGAGVASSAGSPGGNIIIPPEAVLTFHLAQPTTVRTVSEAEMQRLAYSAGPGSGARPLVQRRYPYGYPPPPPPPGYYPY